MQSNFDNNDPVILTFDLITSEPKCAMHRYTAGTERWRWHKTELDGNKWSVVSYAPLGVTKLKSSHNITEYFHFQMI